MSLLALTQQVKYLAECVQEIVSNSRKEPDSPVYGIPGPSRPSGSQQAPIIIDSDNDIKEEKSDTAATTIPTVKKNKKKKEQLLAKKIRVRAKPEPLLRMKKPRPLPSKKTKKKEQLLAKKIRVLKLRIRAKPEPLLRMKKPRPLLTIAAVQAVQVPLAQVIYQVKNFTLERRTCRKTSGST